MQILRENNQRKSNQYVLIIYIFKKSITFILLTLLKSSIALVKSCFRSLIFGTEKLVRREKRTDFVIHPIADNEKSIVFKQFRNLSGFV